MTNAVSPPHLRTLNTNEDSGPAGLGSDAPVARRGLALDLRLRGRGKSFDEFFERKEMSSLRK
jgi:hypothetical protein